MNETVAVQYRGKVLNLSKDLCDKYAYLKRRAVSTADIDQYLYNEADKTTNNSPLQSDPVAILNQFSIEEAEKHINDYLAFEIRLRGGKDFVIP